MLGDGPIWRGILDGRYPGHEQALARLCAHNEQVKQSVRADRLLVYDVEQGWGPLCELLELPAPDAPFPI